MNHLTTRISYGFVALLFASVITVCWSCIDVSAQEIGESKDVPAGNSKEAGRDPFKKYEPLRTMPKKKGQVMVPSIQERIQQYKAQRMAAINFHMPAPKPTTALLLSEIQVVGISRTPRGYAAIVEATPIKLSYVIYPGERFYDGQFVAVEDSRLIFRHETVFTDGRRERAVEVKPLRQPSAVNALTAAAAPAEKP